MKTCPNPNCKATGIPDEAKFCPNCGTQLSPGKWEIVDKSLDMNIKKASNNKRFILQNDTQEILRCFIDGNLYTRLSPDECCSFEITNTTTIRVVSSSHIYIDIKLYVNDINSKICISNNWGTLRYKLE